MMATALAGAAGVRGGGAVWPRETRPPVAQCHLHTNNTRQRVRLCLCLCAAGWHSGGWPSSRHIQPTEVTGDPATASAMHRSLA
jgi:hypothetical protein